MTIIKNQPGNALPTNQLTGTDQTGAGVTGQSNIGPGVLGQSLGLDPPVIVGGPVGVVQPGSDGVLGIGLNGVHGQSAATTGKGVWGHNTGDGVGVFGSSVSGNAGEFTGNVLVTGTLNVTEDVVLTGADCAEQFDVVDAHWLEPGTVVVIDQDGALRESHDAYDKKVAGIVSGAGGYRPGVVLDRRASEAGRTIVALIGKVYCKVDAEYGPIEMGDLLTPSPNPGHAMKASDPYRAFGAVIGKALRPLRSGTSLIPVLVALQ